MHQVYTGIRSQLRGLNLIGLKRKGLKKESINEIFEITKKIFNSQNAIEINMENLTEYEKNILEIKEIINFINLNLKRGIARMNNDQSWDYFREW